MTLAGVLLCLCVIGGQLVRLALRSGPEIRVALAEPLARSWSRPDIVDRNGRLLATDIAVNSLYADPQLILDLDEAIEKARCHAPRPRRGGAAQDRSPTAAGASPGWRAA